MHLLERMIVAILKIHTLTLILLCAAEAVRKEYHGYKLIRVTPRHEPQIRVLRALREQSDLDFWAEPTAVRRSVDLAVSPAQAETIYGQLLKHGMKAQVLVDDLEKLVEKDFTKTLDNATAEFSISDDPRGFKLDVFHQYQDISNFAHALAAWYPEIVSVHYLGKTYENRDLIGVRIGKPRQGKKSFWIDAGIHAREWIAPAAALYLMHKLVTNYSSDPVVTKLVDHLDWYFVPQANPDGYEYTWTTERYWRKTRSKQGSCYGVDPNRNWDHHWGGAGTSDDPCSDIYRGPIAFSEPETLAMSNMIKKLGSNLKAYVSLHSFGQLWLVPYGYAEKAYPPDFKELVLTAKKANAALARVHGSNYTVENSADLYAAAGASDDWAKGVAKIKYVYTIELRPDENNGDKGFNVGPDQIIPTGEELYAGMRVIAQHVMDL